MHAGGLRYHGDSPMLCGLVKHGLVEARAYRQNETFAAALRFARTEGIIPGPEPAHAIRAVIDEAEAAKQAGEERVILLGLSGHGHFDMSAYESYLAGELEDPEFSEADMEAALGAPAGRSGDRLALLLAPLPRRGTVRHRLGVRRSGAGRRRLVRPCSGSVRAGSSPARRCAADGHGSASPLSQAGPRPPGQRPRKISAERAQPERLHDRRRCRRAGRR